MSVVGKISTALVLIGIGVGVTIVLGMLVPGVPWSSKSSSDSSLVITAIERTEQVALLSVGVQGITERRESRELFGFEVPGSDRASFIQYSFDLKMGIDGSQVTIEETGDNSFTLTIPEFTVIGSDRPHFETIVEDNGVLSWVSADIDELDVANEILNDDKLEEYVDKYDDLLRDQTEQFYGAIITSIDPDFDVDFVFSD